MKNPNFPQNLQIKPLTFSDVVLSSSLDTDNVVDEPDQFGVFAQQEAIGKYGIAGRVWEAAYALSLYIDPPLHWEFDPPFDFSSASARMPYTIIELGSGTGIIGRRIASKLVSCRDLVVVTDLPEVCPLLQKNLQVHENPNETVTVRPLTWGSWEDALRIHSEILLSRCLTHIICSDLVYFPELLAPLLRSLIHLSSPPFVPSPSSLEQDVTVVISYKVRSLAKESPFWSAFGLWFSFEPVLRRTKAGCSWARFGSLDDSPFVFIAHRRPESFSWVVPSSDRDLLSGVGAHRNMFPKSDDTFETILLMSMDD